MMLAELSCLMLAALDAPVAQSVGRRLRGWAAPLDTADLLTALLLLAGVALGGWVLSRLAARRQRIQRSNHPGRLFQSLCKTHGLDRRHVRMLTRLAAHHQLANPALLFVDHRYFDERRLDPGLAGTADQRRALRDVLFAGLTLANEPHEQREAATGA